MVNSLNNHQDIPDEHHVARYCRPKHLEDGQITAQAFELRTGENYLSTNWMEYFNTNNVNWQIECVRKAMSDMRYKLKPTGKFARLSVAKIKNSIDNLQVKNIPSRKNPSHAGIYSTDINTNGSIAMTVELSNSVQSDDIFPAV